ncbi:hypothetical protein B296_00034846 [Ensete ventricosum]|uniref:Uncharacterized protein n=1 Tax=Ensete ventricosum TaxID=4639 RepID=A0A426ZKY5_ENSVE|nr:hypothetical protein B296_00034846 [Ensete ventricosum]
MTRKQTRQWQLYRRMLLVERRPSFPHGHRLGEVGAVGEGGRHNAGLDAHVGAGRVSLLAVGAALVAVGEAEGVGCGRRRRHEHGDEEKSNHGHLGLRHCPYGKVELEVGCV